MKPENFDQSLAALRDTMPKLWWALYQGSNQAGFTEEQSFSILQVYILASCAKENSINPGKSPPTDDD